MEAHEKKMKKKFVDQKFQFFKALLTPPPPMYQQKMSGHSLQLFGWQWRTYISMSCFIIWGWAYACWCWMHKIWTQNNKHKCTGTNRGAKRIVIKGGFNLYHYKRAIVPLTADHWIPWWKPMVIGGRESPCSPPLNKPLTFTIK